MPLLIPNRQPSSPHVQAVWRTSWWLLQCKIGRLRSTRSLEGLPGVHFRVDKANPSFLWPIPASHPYMRWVPALESNTCFLLNISVIAKTSVISERQEQTLVPFKAFLHQLNAVLF